MIRLLVFEGIDRSGKTSLRREVLRRIPNIMTIDRFTVSQLVYNKFYNRNQSEKEILELDKRISRNSVIIYTYCNYETYIKRCIKTKHEIMSKIEFYKQRELFHSYVRESAFTYRLFINTDVNDKEDCANKVVNFIKKLGD